MNKLALGISIAGGSLVAGYEGLKHSYIKDLQNRLPEGGTEEPLFPYLECISDEARRQLDLGIMLMGGPAKQALLDPATSILPEERKIIIGNRSCQTQEKATLYRRGENTLRDADIFVTDLVVGNTWRSALPEYNEELDARARKLQLAVNGMAQQERGFMSGPEISLFGYENPASSFSLTDYATTTQLLGSDEVISHPLGASESFEQSPIWTLCVNGMELPTCSPVRLLGRTETRTLIPRKRDQAEVAAAVQNITAMGLADIILGEEWRRYESLREKLDASAHPRNILRLLKGGDAKSSGNLVAARLLIPLAGAVETSFIGTAMRDPGSKIARFAAGAMGAHNTAPSSHRAS